MCLLCSFLELLELRKVALLFLELHAIGRSQLTLVFLLQFIDCGRLDTLGFCQVEICAHATLVLHKLHHMLLDEGHAQDVQNLWSFLFVFDEQPCNKILHLL